MKIMTAEIAYVTIVAKSAAVALHSIISIVCGQWKLLANWLSLSVKLSPFCFIHIVF